MSGSGISGSGMFDPMNTSNDTFSCRTGDLSSNSITNDSHWQINENTAIGATVVGVIIFLFFLVATIWNLFIIITFFVKYHLLSEPANIFLLNVAITDLLICLTTMVFSFVTAFAQEFVFGSSDVIRCAICGMSGFFLTFLVFVSLHLLMAMSIDRFILLSRPLRYKRLMNRWKAILICIIIYVICFIMAILPLLFFGEIEFNSRFASCVPRFTPTTNFFYVAFVAVEALIPIIVLAITNVWTYRLVSKFLKRNFRRRSTYNRRGTGDKTNEDNKHQRQQKQLVKVFGALFIANIISYTPTILTIFLFGALAIKGIADIIPSELYIIGFVSFLTSAVLHPIVESFFVKELRYQVNRARKGVRRVSTVIYRQTTQIFSNKTLDEANRKMDENSTNSPIQGRSIRFLNGRTVNVTKPLDETVTVEMDSVGNSSSSHSRSHTPEQAVDSNHNDDDEEPAESPQMPMSSKSRRSVTFSVGAQVKSTSALPHAITTMPLEPCLKHSQSAIMNDQRINNSETTQRPSETHRTEDIDDS